MGGAMHQDASDGSTGTPVEADLDAIGRKHGTDKSSLGHDYLRAYERILGAWRHDAFSMLEIGIYQHASIRTWHEYFDRASIVGVDIEARTAPPDLDRYRFVQGSQADGRFLAGLASATTFRLIVEDGSHLWGHQVFTFETLFPYLEPGGVYICEDLHTSFGSFRDAYAAGAHRSAADYFLDLARLVTADAADRTSEAADPRLAGIVNRIETVEFFHHAVVVRAKGYRFTQAQHGWTAGTALGEFVATRRIDDPVGTLTVSDSPHGIVRLGMRLETERIETVRLRIQLSDASVRDLLINVDRPYLLFHELAHVTVVRESADGLLLDCEIAVPPHATIAAIHVLLDNEENWRCNPFVVQGPIRLPVSAPNGARVRLEPLVIGPAVAPRPGNPFGSLAPTYRSCYTKAGSGRRDVVLFASWVPEEALPVGAYFLEMLTRHHRDSKILVGVNHGSSPRWPAMVRESGLDVEVCDVPDSLRIDSDAAGYVAALDRLRASEEAFDLAWFIHTKGATSPLNRAYAETRWTFEKRLWGNRRRVDEIFADRRVGIYAPHWIPWNTPPNRETGALAQVFPSRWKPQGLMALATSYVMRAEIVAKFCHTAPRRFFAEGPIPFGGSRFFFESGFPSLPSLLGFEPFVGDEVGGTVGPEFATPDAFVWGDEHQNHRLVRAEVARWRSDPERFDPKYFRGFQANRLP